MRKLFLAALFAATLSAAAPAQQPATAPKGDSIPNLGRAPDGPDGIGRLDARVFDEAGNPVEGVQLKLDSQRTSGFFCESWNTTDARGVATLPPLHIGHLRLTVKAKGYETQKLNIDPSTLNEPVRITLKKKS